MEADGSRCTRRRVNEDVVRKAVAERVREPHIGRGRMVHIIQLQYSKCSNANTLHSLVSRPTILQLIFSPLRITSRPLPPSLSWTSLICCLIPSTQLVLRLCALLVLFVNLTLWLLGLSLAALVLVLALAYLPLAQRSSTSNNFLSCYL